MNFFQTLADLAPQALADLRDTPLPTPQDPKDYWRELTAMVRSWARRWNIESQSEMVVNFWAELRDLWEEQPAAARVLANVVPERTVTPIPKIGSGEEHWCEAAKKNVLPDPRTETLGEWLERATLLYQQREQFLPPGQRRSPKPPLRDHSAMHCRWFVEYQVLGHKPAHIAKRAGVNRSAVTRALQSASSYLEIPLRPANSALTTASTAKVNR